ncbi:syntaxin-8 isoform X3 [Leucoraja erinacea]|uniref:syntaxin-8 isoform X3 n=1 Tax=Leucoraja erinaceus TaxID=7782 RepID=UPI0024541BFC|nr:syntaxin-8 isoform X3 [Leucoraja erinacea]
MAGDPWLAKYDSTWRLAQDIAENVHDRNRQQRTGGNPSKFNVTIRSSLQRLQEQINQLKDSLLRNLSTRQITQLEADRHQNMLDDLLTRERQLQTSFKKDGTEPEVMRTSLISTDPKTDLTNPWLMEEPEETRGLDFSEIKHQQQMIIQEQDAGLDALVTVIARQKQMGRDIGNELDEQNGTSTVLSGLAEVHLHLLQPYLLYPLFKMWTHTPARQNVDWAIVSLYTCGRN